MVQDMQVPAGGPRRFLLLQGLMGPFFRRVGIALRKTGYEVYKINFNGGDQLFWRLPNGLDFTGSSAQWPDFVRRVIREHGITDVMLFGDCRPLHRVAIGICHEMHVRVYVFEEGYIRPDWVTLELDGVNGHSHLPRDPEWYVHRAALLPPLGPHSYVPSSFRRRALEAVAYNAADILTRWYFRHWNDYRPWHPWIEGIGWLKRLRNRDAAQVRTDAIMAEVREKALPYMLFPLQLDADAQIRLHSEFKGNEGAIDYVLQSFARHAPADLYLLVKEHPLDNGVKDWRRLVMRIARKYGIQDRVRYLECGDIAVLVRAARGVVTINSTTGTLALASGVPIITLGQAIYDIPGITYQGSLNDFWCNPPPPDEEIFNAFRRVLIDRCLIEGGFFSEQGLDLLVRGTLQRIQSPARSDDGSSFVTSHLERLQVVRR
ncbi:capsule biosynthesis protein [Komagataeibacter rhaeticus]|uniref:Capsular biosynthesis protein n=1 Tax=Komagataeibacter rhaeticus TaxID=215221 RepID=A0A181C8V8_9PROT|nr:capsular biosynthesis protein [Komagataeibacter rhaeticus]ATU72168.1 capsular biosynthesis protein [Komagataeibacter xylinus]QIP34887.1 capsular biosynthesis protein [Komagataeibacter rhaeticus]QOC47420.1 capsular biosynthesis protein [Komagataeibacter rhaeticus]WPP21882.1 capsular biosynthesis protein [Komagataeibacter rhaeticus]SAY47992.1 Capsule polysaccharide biosynthesis protein [Komagataeibacter rhaeticus]